MKKIILILHLITTKFSFGQVNGGFEIWESTYNNNNYSSELASQFSVPNPIGGIINNWTWDNNGYGISQTTDSYTGNYALILHNWYTYVEQSITYLDSINFRPQYLQGHFKYITGGLDPLAQGNAYVTLTRFNGISNDTIATGTCQFDSTVSFTPFQFTLNYISVLDPDSIVIVIKNADQDQDCLTNHNVCNLLYIDNITLSNTPLSVNRVNSKNIVSFYPNPTKDIITFSVPNDNSYTLNIYDLYGRLYNTTKIKGNSSISMLWLTKGVYLFTLTDDQGIIVLRNKILKE